MSALRGVRWRGRVVQVLRDRWPTVSSISSHIFVPCFGWLYEYECEVVTLRETRQGVFAVVETERAR